MWVCILADIMIKNFPRMRLWSRRKKNVYFVTLLFCFNAPATNILTEQFLLVLKCFINIPATGSELR